MGDNNVQYNQSIISGYNLSSLFYCDLSENLYVHHMTHDADASAYVDLLRWTLH